MCKKQHQQQQFALLNTRQINYIYLFTILINVINAKSIIYGKPVVDLNGNLKIPVFVPISWLIHDIHSAKLVGQKSDVKDMMTSDMTPDMNGNFETSGKQPEEKKKERPTAKTQITNRVSASKTVISVTDLPKVANVSTKPEYSPQIKHDQIKDNVIDSFRMKLSSELNKEKRIAKKGLTDEIMFEPDFWPKGIEPLFTTIEVFELPAANKYMGLDSNRTAVHTAPPDPKVNSTAVKLEVSAKGRRVHSPVQLSRDSKNSYYFKNYVSKNKIKFSD